MRVMINDELDGLYSAFLGYYIIKTVYCQLFSEIDNDNLNVPLFLFGITFLFSSFLILVLFNRNS